MFTPDQIDELIGIIKFQHVLFGVGISGKDVISNNDMNLLRSHGINPDQLEIPDLLPMEQSFQFGRLAAALGNYNTKEIKYSDFKKFVQGGGHRALSTREQLTLKSIRSNTFQNVKGLGERVSSNLISSLTMTEAKRRAAYAKILQEELAEGVINRKTTADIVRELGKRTDDWNRDLGRLVETESHNAYEEGRAAELEEKNGADVLVYKDVYNGACQHCIKAYLTGGLGSKPKIFKLSELRANGTNVGRKAAEYLPTLGALHPHCRCTLNMLQEGFEWDSISRSFKAPKNYKQRYAYDIEITIGSNNYNI